MQQIKDEFYYRLYDVLVLSGVPVEIAAKLKAPDKITQDSVTEVQQLARQLIDDTKSRLTSINTMAINVGKQ